jgi:hypothetical protein
MVDASGNVEDEVHIDAEILVNNNMKEGMERTNVRHGTNEQKRRRQEFGDVRTHW